MITVKYCILGAGPSGLTYANALQSAGETSFILLEKEAIAGGLCRSMDADGAPLDIGGGHFLDLKRKGVIEFLFRFMPENEWALHHRISTIDIRNREIDHPLEGNLWQFPIADQVDFIEAIAQAGCVRNEPEPSVFDQWIRWKLGDRIAEEYMLPYNRKLWMAPLNELGTYWLHKLPSVSFRETLTSCLEKKAGGALPAHGTFLYPLKHGYGEVWRRMGDNLGGRFWPSYEIRLIDLEKRSINHEIQFERLVTTIPWPAWLHCAQMPQRIQSLIGRLKYVSIDVDYFSENLARKSHWTYVPSEDVSYHRMLLRHNFLPGSRGYWTESNTKRATRSVLFKHTNEYAYPVSTVDKPAIVREINVWAAERGVTPLGRWGAWEHINSDVAVEQALNLANETTRC
jgi:protoporphyrinogen oxidase